MANKTSKKSKGSIKKPVKKRTAAKKKQPGFSYKTIKERLNKHSVILLILSLLVVAGIITVAVISRGSNSGEHKLTDLGKETAWGIDVSSHNGKINWKKVSKNADFAFIRVGYRGYGNGEIHLDKKAKTNLENANKYNIPVGVYFYSQAKNEKEAKKEAKFLLENIKGYNVTLPVVFDFEFAYKNGKPVGRLYKAKLSKKEKTALVNAFCDTVRDAGYTPGVYASSYIYRSHFNMKRIPRDVFIWVADYNKKVTYGGYYDIWQYSENGTCQGVSSKQVDVNYFYLKKRL